MDSVVLSGLFLPFFGTTLGAFCVFFMKKNISRRLCSCLNGFASGVMVAASIWSLLIPAMENAAAMGRLCFIPAVSGLILGFLFLLLIDRIIPHLHMGSETSEGPRTRLSSTAMLTLAVTIHNLPEGLAVGVAVAGYLFGAGEISAAAVISLSLGIAIQNFPEGAIISLPLQGNGMNKRRAFGAGFLSGVVEPIGAGFTLLAAPLVIPALPYLLSFAAGAMLYVVVEELVPEMARDGGENAGVLCFSFGFSLMMALDVALG